MDVFARSALPINLLDVLVNLGGQAVTAFQPATLDDIAPALCGHALTEAMHTHTAARRILRSDLSAWKCGQISC